jgi:hypothetical protein
MRLKMSVSAERCSGRARSSTYSMTRQGGPVVAAPGRADSALSQRPASATFNPLRSCDPKLALLNAPGKSEVAGVILRPLAFSAAVAPAWARRIAIANFKYEPRTRDGDVFFGTIPVEVMVTD